MLKTLDKKVIQQITGIPNKKSESLKAVRNLLIIHKDNQAQPHEIIDFLVSSAKIVGVVDDKAPPPKLIPLPPMNIPGADLAKGMIQMPFGQIDERKSITTTELVSLGLILHATQFQQICQQESLATV